MKRTLHHWWFSAVHSVGEFIRQWGRYLEWRGRVVQERAANELERALLEENIRFDREWTRMVLEKDDGPYGGQKAVERELKRPHESQYRLSLKNVSISIPKVPMVIRDKWYLPKRPFSSVARPQ